MDEIEKMDWDGEKERKKKKEKGGGGGNGEKMNLCETKVYLQQVFTAVTQERGLGLFLSLKATHSLFPPELPLNLGAKRRDFEFVVPSCAHA